MSSPSANGPNTLCIDRRKWKSLAASPDIIMTLSDDARILFINRVLPGFEFEKVIGSSVYDYLAPGSQEKMSECLERVFTTSQNANAEIVAPSGLGGKQLWYSIRMGPIKNEGKIVAVTLIASDITERR
jgi:PAS domain S-box-containing protein